ncbi:MAG: hypothetical protein SGI77_10775 [Pirellulaceae bacterium]|nr:hypothetical protein [Pirellulaceae bacterium]
MSINWETTKAWIWRVLQGTGLLAVAAAVAYWYFAAVPVREHRVETGEVVAEVDTDESDSRLELLHKNVKKYGTVFNTVSAGTVLNGVLRRKSS